jgi:predicted PurR-regulated permease PerM
MHTVIRPPFKAVARALEKEQETFTVKGGHRSMQHIIVVTLFLLVLWMARSYLVAAAWGIVIAIAIWPLYQYMANAVSRFAPISRRRNWLAALLTTMVTAVCTENLIPLRARANRVS